MTWLVVEQPTQFVVDVERVVVQIAITNHYRL